MESILLLEAVERWEMKYEQMIDDAITIAQVIGGIALYALCIMYMVSNWEMLF